MTTPDAVDVEGFCPARLVLARERRGFTQRKLAELVGVSDRIVKAYEAGQSEPSEETLRALARELRFPVAFFSGPPLDPLTLDTASFRALTKASAGLRHSVVAAGTIALDFHHYLSEHFDLPKPDVPDLRHSRNKPETAAEGVRMRWGLGQRPIQNVVHLLEAHGVRVFSLAEDVDAIDAFSFWRDGTPFVFLNGNKTSERGIFDAAHELGHLVLHQHGPPKGRDLEQEADRFAACFLLPDAAARSIAPRLPTIAALSMLKAKWRCSVAFLGHRFHDLGLMSDWHYRHLCIELNRRGRKNEPAPVPRETSEVLRQTLAQLAQEGRSLRDIARELRVPVAELQSLCFRLHVVEGDGDGGGARRGALRLVT